MSLITREDLEATIISVSEAVDGDREQLLPIILAVLEVAAPDKLMQPYEVLRVITHCCTRPLSDLYDISSKSAAIELQLPELWALHMQVIDAMAESQKMAEFLSKTDAELVDL